MNGYNLPNDLLNLFEEGEYPIPELKRWAKKYPDRETTVFTEDKGVNVELDSGQVGCCAFPIVVMTSNGERDFPPAFKRRCIRINMPNPSENNLIFIVKAHMGEKYFDDSKAKINDLIKNFLNKNDVATDQLLNTIYMSTGGAESNIDPKELEELLFKSLSETEGLG